MLQLLRHIGIVVPGFFAGARGCTGRGIFDSRAVSKLFKAIPNPTLNPKLTPALNPKTLKP